MVVSFLLSCYLTGLLCFLFFIHPLFCCMILVYNAIVVCFILYLVMGFSWYVLVLGLVYIGGVYVLLVFVSFSNPNVGVSSRGNVGYFVVAFVFMVMVYGVVDNAGVTEVDHMDYLCSSVEGSLYCFFSVLLLVGFVFISLISNVKDSFFR